jgi:hypothetical protein
MQCDPARCCVGPASTRQKESFRENNAGDAGRTGALVPLTLSTTMSHQGKDVSQIAYRFLR